MTPTYTELRRLLAEATQIEGFPGYHVTRCGRVLSTGSNWRGYGARELRQHPNSHGYPSVHVQSPNGRRQRILVHTAVARAFLPPRPSEAHQVRHLDGTRTNNRVENLAWGTAKENARIVAALREWSTKFDGHYGANGSDIRRALDAIERGEL